MPKNSIGKNAEGMATYQIIKNKVRCQITQRKDEKKRDFIERCNALDDVNVDASKMTFDQAYQSWLANHIMRNCSPAYKDQVDYIYQKHLKSQIGFRSMSDILPKDLTRITGSMALDNGNTPSEWTVRHTLKVVSSVYKYTIAQHDWKGVSSPTTVIKRKMPKQYAPDRDDMTDAVDGGSVRVITASDLERFRQAIENNGCHYKYAFDLYIETGLRRGELLTLIWTDIDWNGQEMNIRYSKSKYGVSTPKTEKGYRTVPLSEKAMQTLCCQKLYLHRKKIGKSKYVFPTVKGSPSSATAIISALVRVRKQTAVWETVKAGNGTRRKSKIVTKPVTITFLDMRHTFATNLAPFVSPYVLAAIMGHESIQTTMKYYVGKNTNVSDIARQAMDKANGA